MPGLAVELPKSSILAFDSFAVAELFLYQKQIV